MQFKQDIRQFTLVPMGGGVFEVSVNGNKIYSKKATGQHADPDAIVEQIRKML